MTERGDGAVGQPGPGGWSGWGGPSGPNPPGAPARGGAVAPPWAVQPPRRGRRAPLLIGGAVLVVLLLVAGGLFLALRGDEISYAGRPVAEPQQVVDDAAAAFGAYAASRGGATGDDSGCWFRHLDAATSDVQDDVVCGPVLFVDGDPAATYLLFALTPSAGDGDVTFGSRPSPATPSRSRSPTASCWSAPTGRPRPTAPAASRCPSPHRPRPATPPTVRSTASTSPHPRGRAPCPGPRPG